MATPFSVLMATYAGEKADYLRAALQSLADQTLRADEVVLVCAGPLPADQQGVIAAFERDLNLVRVDLEQNQPLGISLPEGLVQTRNDWVARMDADDVCVPTRFERQFDWLARHPEIDVLGTAIDEFEDDPAQPVSHRILPEDHQGIARMAFQRTPFNHMSVVYKKHAVQAVGGYRNMPGFEDFDLWTRMLVNGARMANISEVLVHARIGNRFHDRRGGLRYAVAEWRALGRANRINPGNRLMVNLLRPIRFLTRLLPAGLRQSVYGWLRRQSA